jgi:TonB family protein
MRLIRRPMLMALTLLVAAPLGAVSRQAIGDMLNKVYENQTLIQRKYYIGDNIHYKADGQAINGGKEGAWTLDAEILVSSVELTQQRLVIKGKRLNFLYDATKEKLAPYIGTDVEIDIETGAGTPSLSALQESIAKVFVTGSENPATLVPDYWKDYLLKPDPQPGAAKEADSNPLANSKQLPGGIHGKILSVEEDQLEASSAHERAESVTWPKALLMTEPSFTPQAMAAKVQGRLLMEVNIDAAGHVTKESIIRPLGLGLDDNAAHAIQTWKFKPAMRAGKPIPVRVIVEISFRP